MSAILQFFQNECSHIQSFSERRSIERRSERAFISSERERERRSKVQGAHPKSAERERNFALISALKSCNFLGNLCMKLKYFIASFPNTYSILILFSALSRYLKWQPEFGKMPNLILKNDEKNF